MDCVAAALRERAIALVRKAVGKRHTRPGGARRRAVYRVVRNAIVIGELLRVAVDSPVGVKAAGAADRGNPGRAARMHREFRAIVDAQVEHRVGRKQRAVADSRPVTAGRLTAAMLRAVLPWSWSHAAPMRQRQMPQGLPKSIARSSWPLRSRSALATQRAPVPWMFCQVALLSHTHRPWGGPKSITLSAMPLWSILAHTALLTAALRIPAMRPRCDGSTTRRTHAAPQTAWIDALQAACRAGHSPAGSQHCRRRDRHSVRLAGDFAVEAGFFPVNRPWSAGPVPSTASGIQRHSRCGLPAPSRAMCRCVSVGWATCCPDSHAR